MQHAIMACHITQYSIGPFLFSFLLFFSNFDELLMSTRPLHPQREYCCICICGVVRCDAETGAASVPSRLDRWVQGLRWYVSRLVDSYSPSPSPSPIPCLPPFPLSIPYNCPSISTLPNWRWRYSTFNRASRSRLHPPRHCPTIHSTLFQEKFRMVHCHFELYCLHRPLLVIMSHCPVYHYHSILRKRRKRNVIQND